MFCFERNFRLPAQTLQKKIAEFFRTGKSPVDIEETLEIIAFLEAASRSRKAGGAETELCLMG